MIVDGTDFASADPLSNSGCAISRGRATDLFIRLVYLTQISAMPELTEMTLMKRVYLTSMASFFAVAGVAMSYGCLGGTDGSNATTAEKSASTPAQTTLAPNDVSVLMPYRQDDPRAFARLLPLDKFLAAETFTQVKDVALNLKSRLHAPSQQTDPLLGQDNIDLAIAGEDAMANYRVVSFRFDPCAPPTTEAVPLQVVGNGLDDEAERRVSTTQCVTELRLVAQPFVAGPAPGSTFDSDTAIHLIYRFDQPGSTDTGARKALIDDLLALKAASPVDTGGKLAVHPGLAADSTGEFTDRVGDFLSRATQRGRLEEIAFMGQRTDSGEGVGQHRAMWEFFRGHVDGSRFTQLDLVQVQPRENAQMVNFRRGPVIFPAPLLDSASEVKDPDVTLANRRIVDCATCHLKEGRRRTFDNNNLRSFGYAKGRFSIATRTEHETDEVVRFANAFQGATTP